MPSCILPPRLPEGGTIGVVSPSWGGLGMFPHRLERAKRYVESRGYSLKLAPHALGNSGYVSGTPEERVADIHTMFADPEVHAIVAAIGGDHSAHLLPLLDFELIAANPKIFMGFSDITVLNVAIWQQTGLVTFNGPAILTDYAENPRMLSYTERHLFRTITEPEPPGVIEPAGAWTEELLSWETREDDKRPRAMQPSPGWRWLREGRAEGHLLGGCLESLQHLRGTRFWPEWQGALFFWETSEEAPTPETVDGILADYENMGVFAGITGMLVGRSAGYSEAQREELHQVILERTARYSFPIIAEMDFGHTAPQFTLPMGVRATIDSGERRFAIAEAAVR